MITLQNLTAGYNGKPVIQNISLNFVPGEVLVLLGPNGCGKSTLLKAALGLLPPMSGEVFYGDTEIRRLKPREIAQKAAFLTQSRNTPSITAQKMVLHGRFPYLSYPRHYSSKDHAIVRQAMEVTGCLPYENVNVSNLSGGERQSVYLAMALAQNTGTVFMDEPTTYLDIHRQLQLMQTARTLSQLGKAVVLVLHDLPMALGAADRVAVLGNGCLQCCDTPENVFGSGILDTVFSVEVHRADTPHGPQYYCTPKKEENECRTFLCSSIWKDKI